MPIATCKCGYQTNSATSNYWLLYGIGDKAEMVGPTKCWARIIDGKWEKGCAFDEADEFDKKFALTLIGKGK